MTVARKKDPRIGYRVKILTCANNLPEHVGQVGELLRHHTGAKFFRVYLDPGLCQAKDIEVVKEDSPLGLTRDNATRKQFSKIRFV